MGSFDAATLHEGDEVAGRVEVVADDARILAKTAGIGRELGDAALEFFRIERKPVTAHWIASDGIGGLERECGCEAKFRGAVVGCGEPTCGERRDGAQPLFCGEGAATDKLCLCIGESDQEGLPGRMGSAVSADLHDGGFEITLRRRESVRCKFIAGSVLQSIQPKCAVEVVEKALLGLWLDLPAPEGDGEVRLAIALQVSKALKGRDAACDANSCDRPSEIYGSGNGFPSQLRAPFAEELAKLG